MALPDEMVVRLFDRARQLGLIRGDAQMGRTEGVAAYLGVARRRVYDLRARGLPAKLIGRRLLFDLGEVDAWLEREAWEG